MRTLAKATGVLVGCALALAPAAGAATVNTKATGSMRLAKVQGPTITFSGTFKSTPFGPGKVVSKLRLNYTTVTISYTATFKNGTVRGVATGDIGYRGAYATMTGTGKFTGGTGIYRNLKGDGLKLTGLAPLTLKTASFTMTGKAQY